jgi:hypothetical protein
VPWLLTRLVAPLVIDYSVRRDFVMQLHWLYFGHARTFGCLGTSHGSSCRSSSTSSITPCVWVPRHVARLVIDYFASRRLVVDFIAYAARPGASARRVAHLAARHRLLRLAQARRRLLRLA